MPWCPNCKAEYQQGVTECSDCKIELVDDINEAEILMPFFQAEDKKVAEKLTKFLNYSDVRAQFEFDEENQIYLVMISPKKQLQAKKLYQAFYLVERERIENGASDFVPDSEDKDDNLDDSESSDSMEDNEEQSESTDLDMDAYENQALDADEETTEDDAYTKDAPSDEITAFGNEENTGGPVYIMKEDQYKDLAGTVGIFLFFGVVGLVFVILNMVGTLRIFNGWIPLTVMGALFLGFIYVALTTSQKAKKVQSEIDIENKLTAEINAWFDVNITESFISSLRNENMSAELNYMKMTDTVKEMLIKEFGSQNLAYLDRLIEEYYTNTFENE